jgi:uncharacterized protein (TIGR04255 family)
MERRQYKIPPIEEALCEFRLSPDSDWDLTVIGRFQAHENIGSEYPGKPVEHQVLEGNLRIEAGVPQGLATRQGLMKVQFPSSDETRLVGVGPNLLSVHVLRPYERDNWDGFKERIRKALEAYDKVAEPKGIVRIGMRYINKVTVPEPNASPERYFKYTPTRVEGIPCSMSGFFCRNEYLYDDGVKLLLTHTLIPPPSQNETSFILDLDVIWDDQESPRGVHNILPFVEELRTRERDAFESLITDASREVFDG